MFLMVSEQTDTLLHRITTSKEAHLLILDGCAQCFAYSGTLHIPIFAFLQTVVYKGLYWYLSVKSTEMGQEWPLIPGHTLGSSE